MFVANRTELHQLQIVHGVQVARRIFAQEDFGPAQEMIRQVPPAVVGWKLLHTYPVQRFQPARGLIGQHHFAENPWHHQLPSTAEGFRRRPCSGREVPEASASGAKLANRKRH